MNNGPNGPNGNNGPNGTNGPNGNNGSNDEQRNKERRIREQSLMMESIVGSLERILNRNFEVKDPVSRYIMFLDKLYMFIDISMSMSEAYIKYGNKEDEISTDFVVRINNLAISIQKEMKMLSNWIQNPIYSPDHPLGKMMMESAKSDHFERQDIRNKIGNKNDDKNDD